MNFSPRHRSEIRALTMRDYDRVSDIISRCLQEVNIRDYGDEHIKKMLPSFAAGNLEAWFTGAEPYVLTSGGEIVGTGTLRGHEIQTVFVDPSKHGLGFGKQLMLFLEDLARSRGVEEIALRSSLTSTDFYKSLQYQIKDSTYGAVGGQMVLMTKKL